MCACNTAAAALPSYSVQWESNKAMLSSAFHAGAVFLLNFHRHFGKQSVALDTFVCLSAEKNNLPFVLSCLRCSSSHAQHNDGSTSTRRRKTSSFFLCLRLCLRCPGLHVRFLVLASYVGTSLGGYQRRLKTL